MRIKFPRYYAIKSAVWRKAGTLQKRCLVIQLLGTSFYAAGQLEKLQVPGQKAIAHIGISKRNQWVFFFENSLWIRYPSPELTGSETRWKRTAKEREKVKTYFKDKPHMWYKGRVSGAAHLWGGDTSWGSNGKFALKPFKGELRK